MRDEIGRDSRRPGGVARCGGKLRFGGLKLRRDAGGVDALNIDRALRQHDQPVSIHLGEPSLDEHPHGAGVGKRGIDNAGAKGGNDRRVAGEHSELAFDARHDHLGGILRQHHALRSHELELECACHVVFPYVHPSFQPKRRSPLARGAPSGMTGACS